MCGRPHESVCAGLSFSLLARFQEYSSFIIVMRVLFIGFFVALPLGLAMEPARASSKCDRLVDSLNQVSLNELEENRDLWLSLDRVITTWNRTNRGQ